ncbi:3,4-dihydroxy-2-butanone-4-phosphate synthase [Ornithinimicrobium sp. W1679]|uniref:3,4-dihydroxy-2-butanone-4-phosphate synthase n=1 Tax=Ornithinimicrobium sp. W1679 TaxID=3418770 RepID=UPI003CE7C019
MSSQVVVPGLSSVDQGLAALRAGLPVLVLDDVDRENEGDVVLAAQTITPRWTGWTIRHSSGYLCAPMPADWADRLGLPPMVEQNEDALRTAYAITVDVAEGVTTGISATDRCRTVAALGNPSTVATDLRRPGHVVPLRARPGGVLARRGHTEAAVDLCVLAGLTPVAAIAELVDDEGEMLRTTQVLALGAEHDLPVLTIEQLVAHRRELDRRPPPGAEDEPHPTTEHTRRRT